MCYHLFSYSLFIRFLNIEHLSWVRPSTELRCILWNNSGTVPVLKTGSLLLCNYDENTSPSSQGGVIWMTLPSSWNTQEQNIYEAIVFKTLHISPFGWWPVRKEKQVRWALQLPWHVALREFQDLSTGRGSQAETGGLPELKK